MLAIVDYGMGNLRSVQNALEALDVPCAITRDKQQLLDADRLVLPGVGSFRAAMDALDALGLREVLDTCVRSQGKRLLGICLGMQLLCEEGEEDGPTRGLGYLPGRVTRFELPKGMPVPHIGFNAVELAGDASGLGAGLAPSADFYFVHSYRLPSPSANEGGSEHVVGTCQYGESFSAVVARGSVFGTQFHPEKSQTNGLRLLRNFVSLRD